MQDMPGKSSPARSFVVRHILYVLNGSLFQPSVSSVSLAAMRLWREPKPLYQMHPRCRLDNAADLALVQSEGSFLKLLLHVASSKEAPGQMSQ